MRLSESHANCFLAFGRLLGLAARYLAFGCYWPFGPSARCLAFGRYWHLAKGKKLKAF